jgi:hypothetical protein
MQSYEKSTKYQRIIEQKCNLKEGKRKGRKRNIPPIPPIIEK